MARQSTTVKCGNGLRDLVAHYVTVLDDWVIVRYRGVEYGVFGYWDGVFHTVEGVDLTPKECTLRKGLPIPRTFVGSAL